jgi:REP element-mobilizing transposase RayT
MRIAAGLRPFRRPAVKREAPRQSATGSAEARRAAPKAQKLTAQPNGLGSPIAFAMSQSLAKILVHFVFSTKHREPLITDSVRDDLHAYIGGIVGNISGTLLGAGSVEDHIHLLISHPRTKSPAEVVEAVKKGSSIWIKDQGMRFQNFHWQSGYGAFSISPSHRPALEAYFAAQREHHRVVTFQDEFRRLLEKYEIPYDETYVWD